MKLHWSPRSPFVRKVMVCAYEMGLVERLEKVRSVTAMLAPNRNLMQVNPWNKIPTLVTDEGQVLFDSDVICEYLDSLHDGVKLHPAQPRLRWQALRWRAFGSEMLNMLLLWRNERGRPADRQMQALIDVFALKMRTGLAMLETETEALARAPFSVGHVAVGCALSYVDLRFADLGWKVNHPRLTSWHAEFEQRPSVIQTMPYDDTPVPETAGTRIS